MQDETDTDSLAINSPSDDRPASQASTASSAPDHPYSDMNVPTPSPTTSRINRNVSVPPRRLDVRKRERDVDNVIASVGKRLTDMTEAKPEDKHEAFGRNVAHKLRNLPNDQRIYLEKIINDAMFEAELGNLSRDCYLICTPARQTSNEGVSHGNTASSLSSFGQQSTNGNLGGHLRVQEISVYNPMAHHDNNDMQEFNLDGGTSTLNLTNYVTNYRP